MAAHKPKKAHVVVEGHRPGVYRTYNEVLQQIQGYFGKVNWGCDSVREAEMDFKAICDWRALSSENASKKLTLKEAKAIVGKI